jgi:hypothetical protein
LLDLFRKLVLALGDFELAFALKLNMANSQVRATFNIPSTSNISSSSSICARTEIDGEVVALFISRRPTKYIRGDHRLENDHWSEHFA